MSKLLPTTYAPLLADLKARVRAAQVKAAVAVNRELILLYWHIGREILRAQKAEGWGAKVVERLAKDLAAEFPVMGGLSAGNPLPLFASFAAWEPVEISKP
jgi:predicted nuclease of restriction endonuclease-like (RecB) superfamily